MKSFVELRTWVESQQTGVLKDAGLLTLLYSKDIALLLVQVTSKYVGPWHVILFKEMFV